MSETLTNHEMYLFFLLGLVIGSFLNTVIYRLPFMFGYEKGESAFKKFNLANPRSHCPKCSTTIPFYYNIPVISFILLKSKCFYCHKSIPYQYPLIELLTGILFLWVAFNSIDFLQSAYLCLFLSALVVLSVIDAKFKLVPDSISISLIVTALLYNFLLTPDLIKDFIYGALGGYFFFFLIEKFSKYLKGIEGLGRGDAKVFASMGALMGWYHLPYILFVASLLGLISVIVFFAIKKKPFRKLKGYSIPFVPALSFGLLINLF
tara:strand:+ start:1084 stop:1872 length:789 start_codon:yes stop_codon:yes gene_type:complete